MTAPTDDWRALLRFRCTGCGNCCRGTIVLVTDADVERLVRGTGRPAEALVRFVPEGIVKLEARSPWWIRFDRGARAVLALRHRPGGACTFLDDANQCTVYAHRPVTCREHPFNVDLSPRGGVQHIALSEIVDCPHDWDGRIERRALRDVVRWNEAQSDDYHVRVRAWNRSRARARTRAGFLASLEIGRPTAGGDAAGTTASQGRAR